MPTPGAWFAWKPPATHAFTTETRKSGSTSEYLSNHLGCLRHRERVLDAHLVHILNLVVHQVFRNQRIELSTMRTISSSGMSYRRSGMGAAMRRMLERESYFGALCRVAKTVLCGIQEFNCIPSYSI